MNLASLSFWILLIVWGLFFLRFYKKSSLSSVKTKDITIDAFFLGIIILMGAVPQLGYIQVLPWLSLTLMHLPVLIGAYLYGWKKGLLFGTAFGLTSWVAALTRSTGALDLLFIYPWVSVLPRMVFGLVSGLLFQLLKKTPKIEKNGWLVGVMAFLLTCFHTVTVFLDLYLFYPMLIGSYFASTNPVVSGVGITFLVAIALGMIGEAVLAAIVVPVSGKAIRKAMSNKG
ncbi:MAG: ECF transporter S component [Bacilli bacterium]